MNTYKKHKKKKKVIRDWAGKSLNLIFGCRHNCRYCYSKADRFNKTPKCQWACEQIRFDKLTSKVGRSKKLIMFPSVHDIHPIHLHQNIYFLRKILMSKNNVLIVTKPHLHCIETICKEFEEYKSQILFRFTIGSKNDEVLKFWEPSATSFSERFESLKLAFNLGFQTSVSCEPLLDPVPDELISTLLPFVTETLWVGRANFLKQRLSVNGWKDEETKRRSDELLKWMNDYDFMYSIYLRWCENPQIRWKHHLRIQLGIPNPYQIGKEDKDCDN